MTNKSPDNTGEKQEIRGDIKTRFKKGESGNPKGRPQGSVSITTEIKKKLNEIPEGQKKTYLDLLINRILKLGVVDGNEQIIKAIWGYVDGMPKQKTDITSGDERIGFGHHMEPEHIELARRYENELKDLEDELYKKRVVNGE